MNAVLQKAKIFFGADLRGREPLSCRPLQGEGRQGDHVRRTRSSSRSRWPAPKIGPRRSVTREELLAVLPRSPMLARADRGRYPAGRLRRRRALRGRLSRGASPLGAIQGVRDQRVRLHRGADFAGADLHHNALSLRAGERDVPEGRSGPHEVLRVQDGWDVAEGHDDRKLRTRLASS